MITIDFPNIKVDENFIRKLDLPKLMGVQGQDMRTEILQKLNAGQDVDGGQLRHYSPGYAKYKQSTGRSTTPNLNFTGELHRSIQVKIPKSETDPMEITFQGTHKGGISNAGLAGTLYARGFTGWFQWSSKGLERIRTAVMQKIDQNLKNLVDVK